MATTENTLGNLGNIQRNPQIQGLQARILLTLSDAYLETGDYSEAWEQANKARNIALQLKTADNTDASKLAFDASLRIGNLLSKQQKYANAAEEYLEALRIAEQSLREKRDDSAWQTSVTLALMKIGDNKMDMNQQDAALNAYTDALKNATRNAASYPTRIEAQQSLASAHSRLGALFADRSDLDQALAEFRAALAIQENIANKQPSVAQLKDYADTFTRIAGVLSNQSKRHAIQNYERALDVLQRAARIDPTDVSVQTQLASAQAGLGDFFMRTDQYDKAIKQYQSALQINEQLLTKSPDDVLLQRSVESIWKKVQEAETASNEKK